MRSRTALSAGTADVRDDDIAAIDNRPPIPGSSDQLSELVVQVQSLCGDARLSECVAGLKQKFAYGRRLQIDAEPSGKRSRTAS
jgi:hypothetical protein